MFTASLSTFFILFRPRGESATFLFATMRLGKADSALPKRRLRISSDESTCPYYYRTCEMRRRTCRKRVNGTTIVSISTGRRYNEETGGTHSIRRLGISMETIRISNIDSASTVVRTRIGRKAGPIPVACATRLLVL